jgi:thiamine biosynthesis lipoprotein
MFRLSLPRALLVASLALCGHGAQAENGTDGRIDVHGSAFGATVSLTLAGVSGAPARQAGAEALAEIARLEKILSPGRADSALAQLNRRGAATAVSPELSRLLQLCEQWREKTGNAFSCRLGALIALWRQAAASGEVPERSELRRQALAIGDGAWTFPPAETLSQGLQLEPGGLSLAFAIDSALKRAQAAAPQAGGIRIDAGDVAVYWSADGGPGPWSVNVAESHGGARYYGVLNPGSRAIAFSDNRYRQVGERRFRRIIAPADGWPVEFAPSTVVVASDAVTAHALATALVVMPVRQGMALVDRLPDVEALIVTESGKTFASSGWYALLRPDDLYRAPWPDAWRFLVEYQIPARHVSEYRRPYVAMWITDADNGLIRQLLVHGDSPRWMREIALWWRRYGRRDESVIDGLARPTVAPGRHTLSWDGRDDGGRRVPEGRYVLHVEAAREHGDRELLTLPFELSGVPFDLQVSGEKELGSVRVDFGAGPSR